MDVGATVWARKTIESEIFYYKPAMWFKIWFYLVSRVNWEDGKLFKKGEALITYKEIMAATRASKAQVEKCIKYLKKEDMIASRRTTRGEVRFILKYAQYQDWSYYKEELEKTKEKTCGRLGEGTDSRNKNTRKNKKNKYIKKKKLVEMNSFGEDGLVLLALEQKTKLDQRFGGVNTDAFITKLNNHIAAKGYKSKSHYHVMMNWIGRAKEEGKLEITEEDFRVSDFETKDDYYLAVKNL